MPQKKPRRKGPEATADPVPTTPPVPAAPPPGEPATKPPFRYQFEKDQAAEPTLTAREEEVVGYVAKGERDIEIAMRLEVKTRTIEKHMKNIHAKLGTKTRTAVAAWRHKQEVEKLKLRIRELGG